MERGVDLLNEIKEIIDFIRRKKDEALGLNSENILEQ